MDLLKSAAFLVVAVALAIVAAVYGRKAGRSLRRGAAYGMMLLGIGMIIDPPARHSIEAVEDDREKASADTGEPEETED